MSDPLLRLRHHLAGWYVAVFAVTLVLFAGSIFLVVEHEIGMQLDRSLGSALDAVERAAAIRSAESAASHGAVDAYDELTIPDRDFYVFDLSGRLIHPERTPSWVADLARSARAKPRIGVVYKLPLDRQQWRASARAFVVPPSRDTLIAVAVADNIEVEDNYPRLLVAFAVLGTIALGLVAAGGSWLAGRATLPAQAALDQMRRFTADAAHQLRTPLSIILSHAEVALRRERSPAEYRAALDDVARETARLGGVVEKLLTLARADAGEMSLRRDRVFLDDVAEEALVTLRPLARDRNVALELQVDREVPVVGDATLLGQLVAILVDNAIQYSPPHSRVTVRVEGDAHQARLVVEDEGPGITPAERSLVFERFYRSHPPGNGHPGAGLGLAIGKWIAEAHGGSVDLRAAKGRGTAASVHLPADAAKLE